MLVTTGPSAAALTTKVVIPSFGLQLSAATNLATLCAQSIKAVDAVEKAWSEVKSTVFLSVPDEISTKVKAITIPMLSRGMSGYMEQVRPLVRTVLNARAYELLGEPAELRNQQIDVEQVKKARVLDVISETPANALIQSALMLQALERSHIRLSKAFALGFLLGGALIIDSCASIFHLPRMGEFILGLSIAIPSAIFALIYFGQTNRGLSNT